MGDLWASVGLEMVGPLGSCGPWHCSESEVGLLPEPWGAIVVDEDGALVDIIDYTGGRTESKEAWLTDHERERWPCLADQTIDYCCIVAA